MTEFIPPGTRFLALPSPFPMKRGGALHGARIAYETWGTLNAARDNAVLILTGLSPDAHAAANAGNPEPGWWEAMLGPGKPIDTDRWFVDLRELARQLQGFDRPGVDQPGDRRHRIGSTFPNCRSRTAPTPRAQWCTALGIERLACVIGNSMGGMIALALPAAASGHRRARTSTFPAARARCRSRSRSARCSAKRSAWIRTGTTATTTTTHYPEAGMRMARKLGVITYRSALEWDGRFGRVRLDSDRRDDEDPFGLEFEVESYLEGHARRFVRRFDPNCYLYLSRSMDWFDLAEYAPDGDVDGRPGAASASRRRWRSAWRPTSCSRCSSRSRSPTACAPAAPTRFLPLPSPQGHDAFLVDIARFGPAVGDFLARL